MADSPVIIDGSQGEGGGQMLRTSLAMSLATGRPLLVRHIRAKRKKPGLMRQHLAAVEAAAQVSQAVVEGATLGSQQVSFRPGSVTPGRYHCGVKSAGSATLVLQTILPALLTVPGDSTLALGGGTHNPMAPPLDFLERAYLPLVARMGARATLRLIRYGFYPRGGGEFIVELSSPDKLTALELHDRGEIVGRRARIVLAGLPTHIAHRERATLAAAGWPAANCTIDEVRGGPGNVVLLEVESRHVTEVFAGFGQLGVPAEQVARQAWREAEEYLNADVPVGPHLADQLMLPLALAAAQGAGQSSFTTMPLTEHATTQADVLRRFLDVPIVWSDTNGRVCVRIG